MKKNRQNLKGKLIGLDGKILGNEKDNEKREVTQPRPHLADMLMLPKKFRPKPEVMEMGQEGRLPRTFEPVDPNDDPSKDQMIECIAKAYPELVSFMREIDQLKQDYAGAVSTVYEMHKAAMGKTVTPVKGLVEDIESLRLRYKKALDVLRGIAFSLQHANVDQLRFNARKFIEDNDRLSDLVDENPEPPTTGGAN